LRYRGVSRSPVGVAERQQQLAPPLISPSRELECLERLLIEPRRLLIGEKRERTLSGALGVRGALFEVGSSDRVVRKLGEVGSRVVTVERLEDHEKARCSLE
jgi:hypothetical protein